MDGTKSWEKGHGKSTQIICTPWYSLYYTMDTKSKVDIIWALQGKPGDSPPVCYNDLTISLLSSSTVSKKDQRLTDELLTQNQVDTLEQFEVLLKKDAPDLLQEYE